MLSNLKDRMVNHIVDNRPDLVELSDDNFLTNRMEKFWESSIQPIIEEKRKHGIPDLFIEEEVWEEFIVFLGTSQYDYVSSILFEYFIDSYISFSSVGILKYELLNIVILCERIFSEYGYSDANQDDRILELAVISAIDEYLRNRLK